MKNLASFLAIVAVVLAGFALVRTVEAPVQTGGVTNFDELQLSDGVVIGTSGSRITTLVDGTCNLIGAASIAATSTGVMDCAVSAARAGDVVLVTSATTTAATGAMWGWDIAGASASSTNGFVTMKVRNMTGVAGIPPITATSGIQFLILR